MDTDTLVKFIADKLSALSKTKNDTLIVSLIGGAASGKSFLASQFAKYLNSSGKKSDFFSTDDFLIGDRLFRRANFEGKNPYLKYNFDLLNEKLDLIRRNRDPNLTIPVPTYDPQTGIAIDLGEQNYNHQVSEVNIFIVEGDFDAVTHPDLIIFLDMPDELRLKNRIGRDLLERNEETNKIIENFKERQTSQHIPYTSRAKIKADWIINAEISEDGIYQYNVMIKR